MTRDAEGGKMVNICGDIREDIYIAVANQSAKMLEADSPFQQYVGRKSAKRITMTVPYGLTRHSAKDYITDYLVEKGAPRELYRRSYEFASTTYDAVHKVMTGAGGMMEWLQKTSVDYVKLKPSGRHPNIPKWYTPDGFLIVNEKYREIEERVKISSLDRTGKVIETKLNIRKPISTISSAKIKSSIAPNYTHGMDATHLRMTASEAANQGIIDFVFIHDSYGTRPNETATFGDIIREQFVELYREDVTETFRLAMESDIKAPMIGTLNLEDVLKQPFFFA